MDKTEQPKIAGLKPIKIELEPGTYSWCSCGLSQSQPFCDGSHCSTKFQPIEFTVSEKKSYSMCTCKRSAKSPFCDGIHKTLIPPPDAPV